jgi:N-methylhydantoinase A/oxoprolinase/acetone carboxylase beta subunit
MNSRLRVASDVGGTFTDNLAYDVAEKRITVAKVPTTPENRALGTVRGLRRALAAQGRDGGDLVYVGHGMTTATNALLLAAQRHPHRVYYERRLPRPAADRPAEPAQSLRHS